MTIWPAGYDRIVLDEVGSTMIEAARIAPQIPTWVMARRQTAARGRRGRVWHMPDGNFAASLAMRPGDDPARLALRSFVAALALRDALLPHAGLATLTLKWPNDVLLNGGKVAGILLESTRGLLVIGIGVNLVVAPEPAQVEQGAWRPVSLLAETGVRVAPEDFLTALAAALAQWEDRFATFGFDPIRNAWLAHAARLGEQIIARTPRDTHAGRFDTVDEAGNLVLTTTAGRVTLPAADVHF